MEAYHHSVIAREGWWIIFLSCMPALIGFYQGWYVTALVCLLPLPLLAWYFRDPTRIVPAAPLGIVSPADGNVTAVGADYDPFLERECIRITIDMNWYGVFSIRNPMEGKIQRQWFERPAGTAPWLLGMRIFSHWVQSDEHDDVVVCKEPKLWRLQSVFYQQPGERVGQGQRCGYLYFGARVHVLLPGTAQTACKVGDRVRAGSDLIARLVH